MELLVVIGFIGTAAVMAAEVFAFLSRCVRL